ncbi:MAG: penicillin-binding protein 2 [Chloroflexi bacterium]|nr:penicillin-binding protein 2 [Chloroflexota bacterium]BCY19179.1 stage V sporulation protein D [Leptolinea sp. HRD-7]
MNNSSFFRLKTMGILFTALGLLIIMQVIRIQNSPAAQSLSADAIKNYDYAEKTIYPERGYIFDRWGRLLAGNKEVYEVGVDLRYVKNPETISEMAHTVLNLDYDSVHEKVSQGYMADEVEYVVLSDFVSPEQIATISETKENYKRLTPLKKGERMPSLEGVVWAPHLQRSYPENALASNIIGFYSFGLRDKGRGYFGVEEKYNDLLAGSPIKVSVPQNPYKVREIPTIPPGASIILTIDKDIQANMESIANNAMKRTGSTSATIIVMNPKNGEILAMATTPNLNLNEYWNYEKVFPNPTPFNRAIGQTYEPGSVFKVLTMAAAVDAGVVTPDTPFLDTGSVELGGYTIYNWDRNAWGPQTMTTCMQHSLNVCLTWVAQQTGATRFYQYLQAFGIGRKTNIDLAGEVNFPLALPDEKNWSIVNLGTNSFGQGVATTPLQMITAVSSLANDGKMMAPHIIQSIVENGRQYNNTPQVIGNPVSAKTARTMTQMLAVSLEEEASDALVEGYRVAGKTGTAEIPSPQGYVSNLTNASFVGWGPVDDPRFVVYVWLEKPKSSQWGSIVAAPVFSQVVQSLVVSMKLPPDSTRLGLVQK